MAPPPQKTLFQRHRSKSVRRRLGLVAGLCLLITGYALLAVSPDTPTDWVMFRVVAGFAFLFVGFATAISPFLAGLVGDDE
jgi:hypothetical protein